MSDKYEFTGETKMLLNGVVVKQITRIRDGEAEKNLDQENAWVSGNAWVYGMCDHLHIAGLKFAVTILNSGSMSIGCQTKTFAEWRAVEFAQQRELDQIQFDKTRAVLLPMLDLMES